MSESGEYGNGKKSQCCEKGEAVCRNGVEKPAR